MIRIGHGYDVHAFGGNRPLVLAGVDIPEHVGVLAHSDGDVILHAICDALLGALALGDIGHHFPDTDQQFDNIDSRSLLRQVFKLMREKRFSVSNIDVTVIAQTPRLAGYIEQMKCNIGDDLQSLTSQINLKATTTEKLGYIGRKEGIAVHCVCLLVGE